MTWQLAVPYVYLHILYQFGAVSKANLISQNLKPCGIIPHLVSGSPVFFEWQLNHTFQ